MELSFSNKEITAWGGMALIKKMLDRLGFSQALEKLNMPPPGSNRGYRPVQLITQFMLTIWCGGNRFAHSEIARHDPVLQKIFGFKTMANFQAITRLFERFSREDNERVADGLYRWFYEHLSLNGATLDLDSTIMTRYGQQEGTKRGYNPKKPGRVSHHPLLAFVDETTTIANCWLRPGNASSASNVCGFLDNTLSRLGAVKVALVRADSGFCDNAFLSHLEDKGLSYVIALRHQRNLQHALIDACAPDSGWIPLKDEAGVTVPGH